MLLHFLLLSKCCSLFEYLNYVIFKQDNADDYVRKILVLIFARWLLPSVFKFKLLLYTPDGDLFRLIYFYTLDGDLLARQPPECTFLGRIAVVSRQWLHSRLLLSLECVILCVYVCRCV